MYKYYSLCTGEAIVQTLYCSLCTGEASVQTLKSLDRRGRCKNTIVFVQERLSYTIVSVQGRLVYTL